MGRSTARPYSMVSSLRSHFAGSGFLFEHTRVVGQRLQICGLIEDTPRSRKRRRASGAPRTISRSAAVKENTGRCDK
jgi:hypothetical protein